MPTIIFKKKPPLERGGCITAVPPLFLLLTKRHSMEFNSRLF